MNPGSWAAIMKGCRCSRLENANGLWMPVDGWVVSSYCELHGDPGDDPDNPALAQPTKAQTLDWPVELGGEE